MVYEYEKRLRHPATTTAPTNVTVTFLLDKLKGIVRTRAAIYLLLLQREHPTQRIHDQSRATPKTAATAATKPLLTPDPTAAFFVELGEEPLLLLEDEPLPEAGAVAEGAAEAKAPTPERAGLG